jgi:site-specific DNA recombinase
VDAHDRLQEAGVALRSATEPIDTSNPSGRLIFQMLASFAESERASIHEGVPSPGRRFKRRARQYGAGWSPATVADIVHQSAYSGLHRAKAGKEVIERAVPAIVEPSLQRAAELALEENRHRASAQHKGARRYLLSGLVRCGTCGRPCCGRPVTKEKGGKRYFYYICTATRPEFAAKSTPHSTPRISAPWLEDLVWSDVKRFVTDPGEVLERVREQLKDDDGDSEDLDARLKALEKRLAAKQGEKDRYVRLYAQEHISEGELETHLADLKNQIGNLRLLIEATEADLSQRRERVQVADTTVAWLNLLRERAEEIEEDTPEAFVKCQQLVRLLVERVTLNREGKDTTVMITYRFGPPDERAGVGAGVVANVRNPEGDL